MSQERWTAVDAYAVSLLVKEDAALEAVHKTSQAAGLPAIQVSAPQGKLLYMLARAMGASRILEIGTLAGYSTIWLARALPAGGRLVTIESELKRAELARGNIAGAGLSGVVEVRLGRALDVLSDLVTEGHTPFDLVFIDADKPGYSDYLHWALTLSRCGTLIVADNVVRNGNVIDADSNDPDVQGIRRFMELLATEPRISATVIQTVGVKGYDGFALAIVIRES